MDYGTSSSVAEKVSLAPVYSDFMEAPGAQGIESPPTVGHLLPRLHVHPGAKKHQEKHFAPVNMGKCRRP